MYFNCKLGPVKNGKGPLQLLYGQTSKTGFKKSLSGNKENDGRIILPPLSSFPPVSMEKAVSFFRCCKKSSRAERPFL
jgi:hypothetical protein